MQAIPAAEIESLYERIRAFVMKRVNNAADAEEIVQDIFLKMEEGLPRLREGDRLVPWLYRIARNRIIDHYRTRRIEVPPLKQAAERLGITLTAAKSRHQRAKKRLRENLESCCTYLFDRRGRVIDYTPKDEPCH